MRGEPSQSSVAQHRPHRGNRDTTTDAWIALNSLSDVAKHQGMLHAHTIDLKSDRLLVLEENSYDSGKVLFSFTELLSKESRKHLIAG